MATVGQPAEIEAPRRVCELYNRANLKGFDSVGYFVFEGVKVFEMGKVEEAKRREGLTVEDINFGGKK